MECPSCRRQNPDEATECAFCSVVFAKFIARKKRTNPEMRPADFSEPAGARTRQSSSWNVVWLLVGLGVLAGGAWHLHQKKLERAAKARAKARVEAAVQRSYPAARAVSDTGRFRGPSLSESAVKSARAMAGSIQKARGAANAMSAAGEESKRETDRALGLNPGR